MDKPAMTSVSSSNISAVGHHKDRNELHVLFKSGNHYVYHDAPSHHADKIKIIGSPIGYVLEHIFGKYQCTKVD